MLRLVFVRMVWFEAGFEVCCVCCVLLLLVWSVEKAGHGRQPQPQDFGTPS
jgi:hypothetical protein